MKRETDPVLDRFLVAVTAFFLVALVIFLLMLLSASRKEETRPDPAPSVCALLRQAHNAELSDWQELQMALMLTESRFNPDALGAANDRGILQLVPIYVAEANRIAGTDYTPQDAHDIDKALEMFAIVQGYYNPTCDTEKGIYYHNKGEGYRRAVLRNLELIRRYEDTRKHLTK